MTKAIVGIIGGSGVYNLDALTDLLREEKVSSPWGEPSGPLRLGKIGATDAAFLARHGQGHRLSPSGINYRANIDALKRVGVTDIILRFPLAVRSSASSLSRPVRAGRPSSTTAPTGARQVSSAMAASPISQWRIRSRRACSGGSPKPRRLRASPAISAELILCIEGPQFSSSRRITLLSRRAASDVIGMTGATEAKLAREAEDFLRDDRDGHRFRLLARGAQRR